MRSVAKSRPARRHAAEISGKRRCTRIEAIERQKHLCAGPLRFTNDPSRDAIARREIARGIVALHERLARGVDQPRAFAAQGLRQQEPRLPGHLQCGRMKLDELEIRHGGAGTVRDRHAVTRRDRRIGRLAEHVACATRREERAARAHRSSRVSLYEVDAGATTVFHDHRHRARVIVDLYVGEGRNVLPQRTPDLAPRRIARVQDAAATVRRLQGECRRTVRGAIELGAPLHQLAHVARPFFDEDPDGPLVAQAIARGDRVGEVHRGAVVRPDSRGDAALRVSGVSCVRVRLGEHDHVASAFECRRGPQRGDTAADN